MSGVQKIHVSIDEDGMRVDRWFKAKFPALTHGALEKLLRKGDIRVDGGRIKSNRRLASGELVRVPPMDESARSSRPQRVEYDPSEIRSLVIYEDDQVIAINKPFGLAVQGGSGTKRHVDGMLGAFGEGDERPRLVHRLDKDTGGLLLLARGRRAAQELSRAFQQRLVDKTYWAIAVGVPMPREGRIDFAIAKRMSAANGHERMEPAQGDDAKKAFTDYQILDHAERVSFLAMRPITGRTHQLRVHAAAIGCPIVGDRKYGGADSIIDGVPPKLHLFCRSMTFRHPGTSRMQTINADLTGHMKKTFEFFSFSQSVKCEWPDKEIL